MDLKRLSRVITTGTACQTVRAVGSSNVETVIAEELR